MCPLPFTALETIEGATLTTILRASQGLGLALGAGFALTVGVAIAGAIAWLHDTPVEGSGGARRVWHGRLDDAHVFVTARGACKLLTPIQLVPHVYVGNPLPFTDPRPLGVPRIDGDDCGHRLPSWATGPDADLHQLGLLLWRMLLGRGLFSDLPRGAELWESD